MSDGSDRQADDTWSGLMIAEALAVNGAKVYIGGRRKEVLNTAAAQVATRLGELKGRLIPYVFRSRNLSLSILRLRGVGSPWMSPRKRVSTMLQRRLWKRRENFMF